MHVNWLAKLFNDTYEFILVNFMHTEHAYMALTHVVGMHHLAPQLSGLACNSPWPLWTNPTPSPPL
jgi:hypothetical protein